MDFFYDYFYIFVFSQYIPMRRHFALIVVLLTTRSVIISQKIYRMTCRIAKMYNI